MPNEFVRKSFTSEEIQSIVVEHTRKYLDPIWIELGKILESLSARISDLEIANNAMINEMKAWKDQNKGMLQ